MTKADMHGNVLSKATASLTSAHEALSTPNDPEHLQTLLHFHVFSQQRFKCTDRCTLAQMHTHRHAPSY